MKQRTTPWLLLAGLTLACAAHAGEPAQQTADETPVYFNGVKVAIDPATGRLRQPTATELKALRATVSPADVARFSKGRPMPRTQAESRATFRKLKHGGQMLQLPESSMTSIVATKQADGSLRVGDGNADGQLNPVQEAASE